MTREEFFNEEKAFPVSIFEGGPLKVPVTRFEFETLLKEAAQKASLPIDDELRTVFCGFVHSLDRKCDSFELDSLISALRKSYSNHLTSIIATEISDKVKAQREANKSDAKAVESNETEVNH